MDDCDKPASSVVGANPRRSTSSLDEMSRHGAALIRTAGIFAGLATSVTILAGASSTSILDSFRDAFAAARSLPLGSRPSPPALEPASLIHTSLASLSAYLGHSKHFDCGDLLARPAEKCVSFTYGPGPSMPVKDTPGTVYFTTGGPWLLVVGMSKGVVVDARWLGQK